MKVCMILIAILLPFHLFSENIYEEVVSINDPNIFPHIESGDLYFINLNDDLYGDYKVDFKKLKMITSVGDLINNSTLDINSSYIKMNFAELHLNLYKLTHTYKIISSTINTIGLIKKFKPDNYTVISIFYDEINRDVGYSIVRINIERKGIKYLIRDYDIEYIEHWIIGDYLYVALLYEMGHNQLFKIIKL